LAGVSSSVGPDARERLRLVALYLGFVAALNLAWEVAQLPLYTLWHQSPLRESLLAAVHCTLGDIIIAALSLLAAVLLAGRGWPRTRFARVALSAVGLGLAYTIFSEWLNVEVRRAWAYAPAMPLLPGIGTGLAPLLQWLVVPLAAFALIDRFRPKTGNAAGS
jgi:hypothetical protein